LRAPAEQKRQEIIRIAAELFDELGYERTSMSAIAARVGGSKATLYAYFPSKQELLRAALDYDVSEEADRLLRELAAEKDLRLGLIQLGIAYLTRLPARMASIRAVANQPISGEFYETVLRPAWQRLADRFAAMMQEGRLKFADPWVTAMHWKGLNNWDLREKSLLSADPSADRNEIITAATAAADAFLTLYAARPGQEGR
jgi:AcrR family transcriptional regulator